MQFTQIRSPSAPRLLSLRHAVPLLMMAVAGTASAAVVTAADCGGTPFIVSFDSASAATCLAVGNGSVLGGDDTFRTAQAGNGSSSAATSWLRLGVADSATKWKGAGWATGGLVGSSGAFSIDSAAWDSYDRLAIGFYVGSADLGSSDLDWVVFELPAGAQAASWLASTELVRYTVVYGARDVPSATLAIPEPGSLVLAGLALAGLVLVRPRQA